MTHSGISATCDVVPFFVTDVHLNALLSTAPIVGLASVPVAESEGNRDSHCTDGFDNEDELLTE